MIGDSTTGKSETVRKTIKLLQSGLYISAETASIVGLTGATIRGERQGWYVDWGFLPLADSKLLSIDGAQNLSKLQWASVGEAERTE